MKRLVIVGAGGRLGAALVREYAKEFDVVGFNHAQLDLGAPEQMRATLGALEFDALINTAAQTNVDRCETHQEEAFAINGEAPGVLAEICARKKARFIHISTDYVFDGEKREPYTEEDEARPISVYGESKREGERRALEANERALDRARVVGVRAGPAELHRLGAEPGARARRGECDRGQMGDAHLHARSGANVEGVSSWSRDP